MLGRATVTVIRRQQSSEGGSPLIRLQPPSQQMGIMGRKYGGLHLTRGCHRHRQPPANMETPCESTYDT